MAAASGVAGVETSAFAFAEERMIRGKLLSNRLEFSCIGRLDKENVPAIKLHRD